MSKYETLIENVKRNYIEAVIIILNSSEENEKQDIIKNDNYKIVRTAYQNGHTKLAEFLLQGQEAEVIKSIIEFNKYQILRDACHYHFNDQFKKLFENIKLEQTTIYELFTDACLHSNNDLINFMLDKFDVEQQKNMIRYIRPTQTPDIDFSAFHLAIQTNNFNILKRFMEILSKEEIAQILTENNNRILRDVLTCLINKENINQIISFVDMAIVQNIIKEDQYKFLKTSLGFASLNKAKYYYSLLTLEDQGKLFKSLSTEDQERIFRTFALKLDIAHNKIATLEASDRKSSIEKANLQAEISALNNDLNKERARIAELNTSNESLKAMLNQERARIAEPNTSNESLTAELEQERARIAKLQALLTSVQDDLSKERDANAKLQEEIKNQENTTNRKRGKSIAALTLGVIGSVASPVAAVTFGLLGIFSLPVTLTIAGVAGIIFIACITAIALGAKNLQPEKINLQDEGQVVSNVSKAETLNIERAQQPNELTVSQ